MGIGEFLPPLLQAFGPWGLLIAYMAWQQIREDKRRDCEAAAKKEEADARAAIDEKDIISREKLATSLSALSVVITGRSGV